VDDDALLGIGAFAVLSGLSITALRHYDEVHLLVPVHVDASTGYRRYTTAQLKSARLIRSLRAVDLPIDDVRDLLAASEPEARR
jgi:DNA-binding transcriptional MerR regulator